MIALDPARMLRDIDLVSSWLDPFGLPRGHYGVILADPPWEFKSWSDKGRDRCPDALVRQKGLAERHYKIMGIDAIKALPVGSLAAPDSALFLWTPGSHLDQAIEVGKAWGFIFKEIAFTWVKTYPGGLSWDRYPKTGGICFGLGKYTRLGSEVCLVFTTKRPPKRLSASVPQVLISERGRHSEKPDEIRARIERLVPGPYCELFARQHRPGWDAWGDQLTAPGGFPGN